MSTILLVDDVAAIRDVMSMFLTDEGYQVLAYGSCEEALAQIGSSLPDLVILDGRLPGMSGWECLEQLRREEGTARLPVLMLTAAPRDGREYLAGETDECTRCLVKPFDLDALLSAIHDITEVCGVQLATA
jgi:two-component system phosphate regulon response regulator PhoB